MDVKPHSSHLMCPFLLSQLLQVLVLVTDGKSSDAVEEGAQILQDEGVTVFAVGTCGHQNLCVTNPHSSPWAIFPIHSIPFLKTAPIPRLSLWKPLQVQENCCVHGYFLLLLSMTDLFSGNLWFCICQSHLGIQKEFSKWFHKSQNVLIWH